MEILGVSWIGIRTERFQEIVSVFGELGLTPRIEEPDSVMFKLPDGDQIEVFAPTVMSHAHFTTGPVAGFGVPHVATARTETSTKSTAA